MHTCHNHTACIEEALNNAQIICQERGVRFTDLRRRVLEMIWISHAPAKAYDILDKLQQETGSAKPPTVYRALDFLLDNRLIHKLNSLNAYMGCAHPHICNDCYFLICTECSEVKECCNTDLAQSISETTHRHNFQAKSTTVEIEGICQECTESA